MEEELAEEKQEDNVAFMTEDPNSKEAKKKSKQQAEAMKKLKNHDSNGSL